MGEPRKLAAILAADVAGYGRLAGLDEDRTLARLRALRSDLIDPTVAVHRGRVVKRTGDGSLIEFRSVVDAVHCALEIQSAMIERNAGLPAERRIDFRIGIHLGDVVEESDGDLMGGGVNIAARLQTIAKPGGICLSEDAYRQVKSRLDLAIRDLGATQLKNITDPVRIYSLEVGTPGGSNPGMQIAPLVPQHASPPLALPERPSIAVLPFQNMSGDPEQEYFADGMVEEIITALSHFRHLFVIARNSSFTYKGRAADIRRVGNELGVRYVLEGSVRKAGNKVRITGQLIDSAFGTHLWAEHFDGAMEDIFDLQDQVTASVVGAIAPRLQQAEMERAKHKPTENLDAYDYYLQGLASVHLWTKEANSRALRLFYKSIELDPDFAAAYGMAAWCYAWRKWNVWMVDRVHEVAETERLARQAAELGQDDAVALCMAGFSLGLVAGDMRGGAALIDRSLALNSNLATAWLLSGWIRSFLGEPDVAIEHLNRAMRLSPLDPLTFLAYGGIAWAHFYAGRYDEMSSWAERALRERPNYLSGMRMAAVGHALAGRSSKAHEVMARVRRVDPDVRVSTIKDAIGFFGSDDLNRYVDGLRRAGLPE